MARTARTVASLPAVHAVQLAEFLEQRWQIDAARLYEGLSIDRARLTEPGARLHVPEMLRLFDRAQQLTGEPGLPIYFGMQMRISAHGYLGFAAMTARTLREALELAVRFAPTRTTALRLSVEERGKEAALCIDEAEDLGLARSAVLVALMIGIWKIGNDLTGRTLVGRAELAVPEPAYYAHFRPLFPATIRFGARRTRHVFERGLLDLPLVTADSAARALAQQACERELEAMLGRDEPARVRYVLPLPGGGVRAAPEVARLLGCSPRTLKRRLAEHDTTFSALVDAYRSSRAELLLGQGVLSLDEIAHDLGYSDAANFSRAYRRWFGRAPRRG